MLSIIVPKKPNFSVKKMRYWDFYQVGQVLSPSLGQVLSHTLFMIPRRTTYKQPLQMIKDAIGDQVSPRQLPQ